MQRAVQTFELGIEQQTSDIGECNTKMNEIRESIDKYKSGATEITKELEEILLFIAESQRELEEERTIMNAQNEEYKELCAFLERKKKELANLGLEIQKMTHENDKFQKERLTSEQSVQDMEKRYDWIADEKQFVSPSSFLCVYNLTCKLKRCPFFKILDSLVNRVLLMTIKT